MLPHARDILIRLSIDVTKARPIDRVFRKIDRPKLQYRALPFFPMIEEFLILDLPFVVLGYKRKAKAAL